MGFFISALLKISTLTIFRFLRCMENLCKYTNKIIQMFNYQKN